MELQTLFYLLGIVTMLFFLILTASLAVLLYRLRKYFQIIKRSFEGKVKSPLALPMLLPFAPLIWRIIKKKLR